MGITQAAVRAELEQHPTMLTYIQEEPACIRSQAAHAQELAAPLVAAATGVGWRGMQVVASGSSANAALCARPFMEQVLGMDVRVRTPGEFVAEGRVPSPDELVVVVSQSGCSTNAIAALDLLHAAGRRTIGITSYPESDFRDHADVLVDYGCGPEVVGYVTKGMTGLVAFLMIAAVELACSWGRLTTQEAAGLLSQVAACADANADMLQIAESSYEAWRRDFTSLGVVYAMGYGPALGVCSEAALKLGETVKVPAFAYECDEYAHGPNLQVTPAYSLFFVDDLGRGSARTCELCAQSAHVSAKCFYMGPQAVDGAYHVPLPQGRPSEALLAPLYELPFFQYVAWLATEELGHWEEHPLMREADRAMDTKTEKISQLMPL